RKRLVISALLRPWGYGSPPARGRQLHLRLVRRVDHRFVQVALGAGGPGEFVAALDITVLAACDVFRRAGGHATGAAECVVVLGGGGDRSFVAGGAGGKRERQRDGNDRNGRS